MWWAGTDRDTLDPIPHRQLNGADDLSDISSSLTEEFENASLKLDLGTLLEVIAGNAVSERACAAIVSSRMCDSAEEMKKSQSEIRDVMLLFDNGEDIPLQGWRDSSKVLSRMTVAGSVISGEELLLVAKAEKKALEIQRSLASREDVLPSLSGHLGAFTDSRSSHCPRPSQSRQQHPCKSSYNCNNNKQFN